MAGCLKFIRNARCYYNKIDEYIFSLVGDAAILQSGICNIANVGLKMPGNHRTVDVHTITS